MRLRALIVLLVSGAALAAALLIGWRPLSALLGEGSTRVEAWVGRQLVAIAGDHLGPALVLGELDYQYPRTVTIQRLRFESDGIAIIEAASARIEFAEIPRSGRPIRIEAVDLHEPVIRVVERDDGSLVGFKGLVRDGKGRELGDGGSTRLSDVLAVTRTTVRDGIVEYERPGEGVMRLEPLTFDLFREDPDEGDEAGWYRFTAALAFDPVAHLDASIRVNLDTATIEVVESSLNATIDPLRYEVFPPQLQTFLQRHRVEGSLHASCDGVVPLRDAVQALLEFRVTLTRATVSFDEYVLPVALASAHGRASEGMLEIDSATLDALGGQARLWAQQRLDMPGRPFHVRLSGTDFLLEEAVSPGAESGLEGAVGVLAELRGRATDLPATLEGSADVTLDDGRLVARPVFRALLNTLSVVPAGDGRDRGEARLVAAGDRVRAEDIRLVVSRVGVKGDGDIFYDGRLNLRINAGPLERLEGALGEGLGKVLGSVTNWLNVYNITGTITDPEVKIRPLGIGVEKSE